jgi:diacylglycerol kinase (ATP)
MKGKIVELRQLTPARRWRSFMCALKGVGRLAAGQPNIWLIAAATVAAVLAGLCLRLNRLEWCFILSAIFLIWMAETFNTAIEALTDLVSPERQPFAGKAKDTAAGAVLIAVLYSLFVAALIFVPHLLP